MSKVQVLDVPDVDEDIIDEEHAGTWTSIVPPRWLPFVYYGQYYVSDVPLDEDGHAGLVPLDVRRAMSTTKTVVDLPVPLAKYMRDTKACIIGEYAIARALDVGSATMSATRLDVFLEGTPFTPQPPGQVEWVSTDSTRLEFAYLPMFEAVRVVKCALDGLDVPVYYTFFQWTAGVGTPKYENFVHQMPFTILSTMITPDGYLTIFDAYRDDLKNRVLMPSAAGSDPAPCVTDEWIRLGMRMP